MVFNEFLNYIKNNMKQIYENFNLCFYITNEEFEHIIKRLFYDILNDKFFGKLLEEQKLLNFFERNSLYALKKYLNNQIYLSDDNIKNLLINTPEILFFNSDGIKIYPIFKGSEFKGFVLLNDNSYRAYSFYANYKYTLNSSKTNQNSDISIHNIKFNYINSKLLDKKIKYKLIKYDIFDNSKFINSLLENLKREDVMRYYGLTEESTLEEKFNAMSAKYNKRDYYFKK